MEQCAPVLAGIKPGSMFPYRPEGNQSLPELLRRWNGVLGPKGVQVIGVRRCSSGGFLIYVYRPRQVEKILREPDVAAFLRGCGYAGDLTLPQALRKLTGRLSRSAEFPHEVGVFLGYPLPDVLGFIEHSGTDCLCSGCWKVYHAPGEARRTFRRYEACTRAYQALYRQGKSAEQLTSRS